MYLDDYEVITYIVKAKNAQKLLMPMLDCEAIIQFWDITDLDGDDVCYLSHTDENEVFCEPIYKDGHFIIDTFGEPEHLYVFYDHPDEKTEKRIRSIAYKCADLRDLS